MRGWQHNVQDLGRSVDRLGRGARDVGCRNYDLGLGFTAAGFRAKKEGLVVVFCQKFSECRISQRAMVAEMSSTMIYVETFCA